MTSDDLLRLSGQGGTLYYSPRLSLQSGASLLDVRMRIHATLNASVSVGSLFALMTSYIGRPTEWMKRYVLTKPILELAGHHCLLNRAWWVPLREQLRLGNELPYTLEAAGSLVTNHSFKKLLASPAKLHRFVLKTLLKLLEKLGVMPAVIAVLRKLLDKAAVTRISALTPGLNLLSAGLTLWTAADLYQLRERLVDDLTEAILPETEAADVQISHGGGGQRSQYAPLVI